MTSDDGANGATARPDTPAQREGVAVTRSENVLDTQRTVCDRLYTQYTQGLLTLEDLTQELLLLTLEYPTPTPEYVRFVEALA